MKTRALGAAVLACVACAITAPASDMIPPITRKDCVDVDYSKRFPPVRNQDGHGLCWAFTAEALAEEELCLEKSANCGKQLSAYDAGHCEWSIGTKSEGDAPSRALRCFLKDGFCFEGDAPYTRGGACGFDNFLGSSDVVKCRDDELVALYDKWKPKLTRLSNECRNDIDSLVYGEVPEALKYVKEIRDLFASEMYLGSGVDIMNALLQSKDKSEFAQKLLLPPLCLRHRKKAAADAPLEVELTILTKATNVEKILALKKVLLGQGRSAAISICLEDGIFGLGFVEKYSSDCKHPHAVVTDGMRWNSDKKRCEMQLRNSWGKNGDFHGWVSADKLLPATYETSYLVKRRKP